VVAAAEMKARRARSTAAAFKVKLTAVEQHAAALAVTAQETLQDKKRLIVQKCRMKKKAALKDGKVLGLLEQRTQTLYSYIAESEKLQLEVAKLESEGADARSWVEELKAENASLQVPPSFFILRNGSETPILRNGSESPLLNSPILHDVCAHPPPPPLCYIIYNT
jgi:hypothetical protein